MPNLKQLNLPVYVMDDPIVEIWSPDSYPERGIYIHPMAESAEFGADYRHFIINFDDGEPTAAYRIPNRVMDRVDKLLESS